MIELYPHRDPEEARAQLRLPGFTDAVSERRHEARRATARVDPAKRERAALLFVALGALMEPRLSLVEALDLVELTFDIRFDANTGTRSKYLLCARRLFRYLQSCGLIFVDEVDQQVLADIYEMPAVHQGRTRRPKAATMSFRRSVTKAVVDELSRLGTNLDRSLIGPPIDRVGAESSRPLSASQLNQLHAYCEGLGRLGRTPVVVALCEAGGSMSEIAVVRVDDIDLDDGAVTFRLNRERRTRLTEWGATALADSIRSAALGPAAELFPGGRDNPAQVGHVLRVQVQRVLRACGIPSRSGITPRSIGLCVASQIARTEGLQAAALHLGDESKISGFVDLLGLGWGEG
jgi:integrase